MLYLTTNKNNIDFINTPQAIDVKILTNGSLIVKSKPKWVSYSTTEVNKIASSLSDGFANTSIVALYETSLINAAKSCLNYTVSGFSSIRDWYLPSIDELINLINEKVNYSYYPLNGASYWSSTEDITFGGTNAFSATKQGVKSSNNKNTQFSVRPIRRQFYNENTSPYPVGYDLGYGIVYDIDTINKIIYIVAKEDVGVIKFGESTNTSSIKIVTGIKFSVKNNDKYEVLNGIIELGVSQDISVNANIVVTQDSSESDSQSVLLDDVIDNIMADAALDEDSYMHDIKRTHAIIIAKRLLQELTYSLTRDVRIYESEITSSNKVIPPIDFVDYLRLSVMNEDGNLIPMFVNKNLNISYQYILDEDGDIIVDNLGYPIVAQGSRGSDFPNNKVYSFAGNSGIRGMEGGVRSTVGQYRYDPQAREFLLDGIPSEYTRVVLEYMSDPILAESDVRRLRIHKYMQSTIETGIYYRYIDKKRNVPMSEKERARRDFYNEVRISRLRINIKPAELIQMLGSDIGINKIL